ncbi:MAG TPA: hypothetical protein VJY47_04245 [Candidatus Dojkabacteria bacterium]|nr:hypothetical protein [Candidatus Dojkabacteria bacterium]
MSHGKKADLVLSLISLMTGIVVLVLMLAQAPACSNILQLILVFLLVLLMVGIGLFCMWFCLLDYVPKRRKGRIKKGLAVLAYVLIVLTAFYIAELYLNKFFPAGNVNLSLPAYFLASGIYGIIDTLFINDRRKLRAQCADMNVRVSFSNEGRELKFYLPDMKDSLLSDIYSDIVEKLTWADIVGQLSYQDVVKKFECVSNIYFGGDGLLGVTVNSTDAYDEIVKVLQSHLPVYTKRDFRKECKQLGIKKVSFSKGMKYLKFYFDDITDTLLKEIRDDMDMLKHISFVGIEDGNSIHVQVGDVIIYNQVLEVFKKHLKQEEKISDR